MLCKRDVSPERSGPLTDVLDDQVQNLYCSPLPITDFRHVVSVLSDVCFMINELIADRLFGIGGHIPEPGNAVDDVSRQVEAVQVVTDHHVKRDGGDA